MVFAETPDVRRHLRRYELHHRLGADEDREHGDGEVADAGFDGVAVQWFDSVADFRALREEPFYVTRQEAAKALGSLGSPGTPGGDAENGSSLIISLLPPSRS